MQTQNIARAAGAQARLVEVKRRYAWQARQQRQSGRAEKPDKATLITKIRLRELERLFMIRYGRFLPDDDAGRDDLTLVAHHIVWLRGEVVEHIVAWARAWAPWMPPEEAERIAEQVAAEPRKWTADALAWLLRLTAAERAMLKITTIGAFDMDKAERAEQRKIKRRAAEKERRARKAKAAGRAPGENGRPIKTRGQQGNTIAGLGFSANGKAARGASPTGTDQAAFQKNQTTAPPVEGLVWFYGESRQAVPPSPDPRADQPKVSIPSEPPPEVIAKAMDIAGAYAANHEAALGQFEVRRLLRRWWPQFVKEAVRLRKTYGGRADDWKVQWVMGFQTALESEAKAKGLHKRQRRAFLQRMGRRPDEGNRPPILESPAWLAAKWRDAQNARVKACHERTAQMRAARLAGR